MFNTFSTSADVEGRVAVGQNMTGGASIFINPNNTHASTFAALTVYGNQSWTGTLNDNNNGGIAIGGSNAGNFTLNSGGNAYVGGGNSGTINASGGIIAVGGANSGQGSGAISINGNNNIGGTLGSASTNNNNVTVNGNTGNVTMSGGTLTYTGTQNGSLTLNGGATASEAGSVTITPPANPLSAAFSSTFQKTLRRSPKSTESREVTHPGISVREIPARASTS